MSSAFHGTHESVVSSACYRVATTHRMLIFVGHFLQNIHINGGSFLERDLQLKAFFASLDPARV